MFICDWYRQLLQSVLAAIAFVSAYNGVVLICDTCHPGSCMQAQVQLR